MFLPVIWIAVLVAALTLYFRKVYSKLSSQGVKHLRVVPLLGNMVKIILRREHFLDGIHKVYIKYPDQRFVGRYEFIAPTIIIRDLDLVKNITTKHFEHFIDHRNIINEKIEPFIAKNLFSLKGQDWKDMRSSLSPAFTSSKIKLMLPLMNEVGEQTIRALKRRIQFSANNSIELDVRDLTSRYTNDVIATCVFGIKVDSYVDEDNKCYEMAKIVTDFSFQHLLIFFFSSAFPDLAHKLKLKIFPNSKLQFFIDLVKNTMKDREARHVIRPDMIHLLMEIKKGQLSHDEKNKADNVCDTGFATAEESSFGKAKVTRVWSDEELIAQGVFFFFAGFETVSTAASFTLYELAFQPEMQERLYQELKRHRDENGGKLDFNSIKETKYLDMVISEALRLWPPIPALDRICDKDYNLGKPNSKAPSDYIIRKGDYLSIPIWSLHRDPKIFPNPDKFDPERFSEENKPKINPMTYMPYGVGPRNCIGSRFGLCELKILLYQILLHMEVSPSEKTPVQAKLMPEVFLPRLRGGLWLSFKTRRQL